MRKLLWPILILLMLLVVAGILGNAFAKEKGYSGIIQLMGITAKNYPKSFSAEPAVLQLQLSKKNFAKLQAVVDQAREEGVIPRKGNKFRKATLLFNGDELKAEVRIKGKLTDHVKGDKWSLRVKLKGNGNLFGMKRFSLQHPGTRNYANEWVFHQWARQEGLIALRYDLVELHLNDSDLGVYALEEHFGQELLANNQRPAGPIIRFDPGLYWQHRLNEMNDIHVLEEYAQFTNANIDTYTEGSVFADSSLTGSFYKAQEKLEAFRSGKLPADSVFKLLPLARYHAIIDVIGGHHSLDWSDVKYYYDPQADLLEPVAYESFSVFPTKVLSGSYRYQEQQGINTDLHNALFSNEPFFRLYVQEIRRMASKEYLDAFFASIDSSLQRTLAILYAEFPYKEFQTKEYYRNVKRINAMLDTPQGFHAYLQGLDSTANGSKVNLRFGLIESLPFEVVGIRTNNKDTILLESLGMPPLVLPSKPRRQPVQIKDLELHLPPDLKIDVNDAGGWRVYYRLLGDRELRKVTVLPYAYLPDSLTSMSATDTMPLSSIAVRLPGMENKWALNNGRTVIDKPVLVPRDASLTGDPGVELFFQDQGRIQVAGRLVLNGLPEFPVVLDHQGANSPIQVVDGALMRCNDVLFRGASSAAFITLENAQLRLSDCRGKVGNMLVKAHRSGVYSTASVFDVAQGGTVFFGGASRFITVKDVRLGEGTYIHCDNSYVEVTDYQALQAGVFLNMLATDAVLFAPELPSEEVIALANGCTVEVRDPLGLMPVAIEMDDHSSLRWDGELVNAQTASR